MTTEDPDTCGLPGGELDLSPDDLAVLHEAQAEHRAHFPEQRVPMFPPIPIDEV